MDRLPQFEQKMIFKSRSGHGGWKRQFSVRMRKKAGKVNVGKARTFMKFKTFISFFGPKE